MAIIRGNAYVQAERKKKAAAVAASKAKLQDLHNQGNQLRAKQGKPAVKPLAPVRRANEEAPNPFVLRASAATKEARAKSAEIDRKARIRSQRAQGDDLRASQGKAPRPRR